MTVGIGPSPALGVRPAYCGTTTGIQPKSIPSTMLDDLTAYRRGKALDEATTATGKGFKKLVDKKPKQA